MLKCKGHAFLEKPNQILKMEKALHRIGVYKRDKKEEKKKEDKIS